MAFPHKVYELKLEEITLIVPTKNEEKTSESFCLLCSRTCLTVVDASDDHTIARILKLRPERTTIIHEPCNVSMARQWGAEQAHTRWLLFSDADVVFPQGYFERLSALADDDVIYGRNLSTDQFKHYYLCFAYGQAFFHRLQIPSASGSNLLIRRTAGHTLGVLIPDCRVTKIPKSSGASERRVSRSFRPRTCGLRHRPSAGPRSRPVPTGLLNS